MKLDDITVESISQSPEEEVLNLHRRIHGMWAQYESGSKYNADKLLEKHKIIFDEMVNRDLRHRVKDSLDAKTSQMIKWFISEALKDDIIAEENALVGKALSPNVSGSGSDWAPTEFIDEEKSIPGLVVQSPQGYKIIDQDLNKIFIQGGFNRALIGKEVLLIEDKYAIAEITIINAISKENGSEVEFSINEVFAEPIKVGYFGKSIVSYVSIDKKMPDDLRKVLKNGGDLVIIPDFLCLSGKTVLKEPSNDYDFIIKAKFDEDSLGIQSREFFMKVARIFPKKIQDELHFVSSPQGACWHYQPVADLVLRFKNTDEVVMLDEDYHSYQKRRDTLDVYAVCFPQNKSNLWELQADLGIPVNKEADEQSLHLTIGVFKDFPVNRLDELLIAIKSIKPFKFEPGVFELLGEDNNVLVVSGSVPEQVAKQVNSIRDNFNHYSEYDDFRPHITLAYDYDSDLPAFDDLFSLSINGHLRTISMSSPLLTFDSESLVKSSKQYKCKFCSDVATKGLIWAEGKAIVPVCDRCIDRGKESLTSQSATIDEVRDLTKKKGIQLLKPFKPMKPAANRSGYHQNEFVVGEEDKMYDLWAKRFLEGETKKVKKKIVVLDIDDTLVSAKERLDRCTKDGKIDWECAFDNDEVVKDPLIKGTPELVYKIQDLGYGIIYLTGRSEIARKGTSESLFSKYGFPAGIKIIMRPIDDFRKDHIIKEEQLQELFLLFDYDIVASADDDYSGKLGTMYESLGIKHFKTVKELYQYLK